MQKILVRLVVVLALLGALYYAWRRSPLHQVKRITTTVEIYAPPDRVWQVLTDFQSYQQWNPLIKQASGTAAVGEKLAMTIQLGDRTMTIHPKVLVATPDKELRWVGHLYIPGLFDGEHSFTLQPDGPNNTVLIQSESYDGLLVVPLWDRTYVSAAKGFRGMNEALKERAESRSAAQ